MRRKFAVTMDDFYITLVKSDETEKTFKIVNHEFNSVWKVKIKDICRERNGHVNCKVHIIEKKAKIALPRFIVKYLISYITYIYSM